MTRTLITLFLLLAFAVPSMAAETHVILLSAAVDTTAVQKGTVDVFAQEGDKITKTLLDNKIHPTSSMILSSKQATRQNLLDGFKWLERTATKDSLVIIYLGAHGDEGCSEFFCSMSDGWVYAYELQPTLERLPCKSIIIVDTCHAGAFIKNWDNPNTLVIAACRNDEMAGVWYVANHFAKAIEEADRNHNGTIDSDELCDYLTNNASGQHITTLTRHFKINLMKSADYEKILLVLSILWLCFFPVIKIR